MRVLVSSVCNFWLTRQAVERARELDAPWAFPDHTPLVGEPQHHTYGDEDVDEEERWEDQYALPATVPRHDAILLQLYDELGSEMSPDHEVHCLSLPDDMTYYVASYCTEWVAEQHREWGAGQPPGQNAGTHAFTIDSRFVSKPPA